MTVTAEDFLQDCPTHQNLRSEPWAVDTAVREKVCGPVDTLQPTMGYIRATGVPV